MLGIFRLNLLCFKKIRITVKLVTMPTDAITLCTIPMLFVPSVFSTDLISFMVTSTELFSRALKSRSVDVAADVILSVLISIIIKYSKHNEI